MVGLRTYGRRLSNDTSSPGGAIYDVVNDSDLGRRLNDAMRGGGEHPALYASRTAADQWNVLPSLPYRTYSTHRPVQLRRRRVDCSSSR